MLCARGVGENVVDIVADGEPNHALANFARQTFLRPQLSVCRQSTVRAPRRRGKKHVGHLPSMQCDCGDAKDDKPDR